MDKELRNSLFSKTKNLVNIERFKAICIQNDLTYKQCQEMIARRLTGRRDDGGTRYGAITQLGAGSSAGRRGTSGESLDGTCRGLGSGVSQGVGSCWSLFWSSVKFFFGRDINSVGSGRCVVGVSSRGAHSDATLKSDQHSDATLKSDQ